MNSKKPVISGFSYRLNVELTRRGPKPEGEEPGRDFSPKQSGAARKTDPDAPRRRKPNQRAARCRTRPVHENPAARKNPKATASKHPGNRKPKTPQPDQPAKETRPARRCRPGAGPG